MLGILKANQVNLRALSVADTADFGILRMIVNEPEKVAKFLRDKGLAVKSTQVLTIAIPDNPGGLLEQVEKLSAAGINVEYVYAFAATSANEARVVFKVDDLEKATRIINGETPAAAAREKGEVPGFYW